MSVSCYNTTIGSLDLELKSWLTSRITAVLLYNNAQPNDFALELLIERLSVFNSNYRHMAVKERMEEWVGRGSDRVGFLPVISFQREIQLKYTHLLPNTIDLPI